MTFSSKNTNAKQVLIRNTFCIIFVFILSFISGQIVIKYICDNYAPLLSTEIKTSDILDVKNINILRLVQAISCIFNFILPSIIIAKIISNNPLAFLHLNRKPVILHFILIIIFLISIMPFINTIIEWNESMVFPDSIKHIETSMREMEDSSKRIIGKILSGTSYLDLSINIIVVAILPAIGEELFFRGVLQNHLSGSKINYHIAIFIASFIFSAIHFQFYGFIPRLILGQIFGYFLYFSKSLWTSIFAHFINNFLAILGFFFVKNNFINEESLKFGSEKKELIFVISGLIIAFFIAKYLKKYFLQQKT